MDSARVDKFLWSIRIYPTRTAATDACAGGHVEINGRPVKASAAVHEGDRVQAVVGQRVRVVEVLRVIDARVGAPIAAACIVDHSPPPPPREEYVRPMFVRDKAAGRPTKKDRRQFDRFRERD